MKINIPQILWHESRPLYSIDFQNRANNDFQRMATCSNDNNIRIWELGENNHGNVKVEFVSNLSRHTRTVNIARFAHNGNVLASGSDDNFIFIWKLNPNVKKTENNFEDVDNQWNRETWTVIKNLRGHFEDIIDLCWSFDDLYISSGSIDNTAVLWNVDKSCRICFFPDHTSYVQGVALNPKIKILATMSSDRCLRIYNINDKSCAHKINKSNLIGQDGQKHFLFEDDSLGTFFRRLAFSPDGKLLVVPSGRYYLEDKQVAYTTYVFVAPKFSEPVLSLEGICHPSISVRFNPCKYTLLDIEDNILNLNYRMIFAVSSKNTILIYDTQHTSPIGAIKDTHYQRINDISWSNCGRLLGVCSTDGYCTIAQFKEDEFGIVYEEKTNDDSIVEEMCSKDEMELSIEKDLEKEEIRDDSKILNTRRIQTKLISKSFINNDSKFTQETEKISNFWKLKLNCKNEAKKNESTPDTMQKTNVKSRRVQLSSVPDD